jgi:hypothetical protein
MDKIKQQANTVSQLVFSADTGETYKRTLILTWDILRETGVLIWLVICLSFVGGEWFYRTSVSLGRSARAWYNDLGKKAEGSEAEAAASTGEALLTSVQSGTTYLLSRARQQLGIPEPEVVPPASAPPTAASTPKGSGSTPSVTASSPATPVSTPADAAAEDDQAEDEA